MAVYAYCRYSTERQEEAEQLVQIKKWAKLRNVIIDDIVIDRARSGAISWENRNLAKLVEKLRSGDTIVCSEISRISRSISNFSDFLNHAMRKIRARIVIVNMGLDIDCGNLNAMVELQLAMLACCAQMERELIQSRVKASLEHRKELARINGGWTSKSGRWCTHLGHEAGSTQARSIARNKKLIKSFIISSVGSAPCSIVSTPFSSATLTPSVLSTWAATLSPSLCASSQAAFTIAGLILRTPGSPLTLASRTPPVIISFITSGLSFAIRLT